jgi:hypothetical protein
VTRGAGTRTAPPGTGCRRNPQRVLQTALGLLWLLDGALQFQPFMYSRGFPQMLTAIEPGQPRWLSESLAWGARIALTDLPLWNTLFALTQVVLGLGILFRPTVKLALAGSFVWVLVVWWFGEAFGMLFTNTASPLTGAPGAVLLYAVVGLVVWPTDRPGGLLGVRGARLVWAALWTLMAWLWLLGSNSSPDATRDAIVAAPSGIAPLARLQRDAAALAAGRGLPIALAFAAVSLAIAIAVAVDWQPRTFVRLAIFVSVGYWVVGQGLGGIATGSATDPNAGPLFVLLAAALLTLLPAESAQPAERRSPGRSVIAPG